jgi:hypothetical protein
MGRLLTAVDGERGDVPINKMADLIKTGAWRDMGLIDFRVPPIVDEGLWWQAQEKLDARRRLPNPQHEAWPLQTLVRCAEDGLTFGCRRNSGKTRVYSCAGREDEPAAVPTARKSKPAVGTLGMSKDGFDAAVTEARFETEYDLRRVFDLFDIKVVVHDDLVEVRGAFPKPIEIDLEEMGSVALLRSQ